VPVGALLVAAALLATAAPAVLALHVTGGALLSLLLLFAAGACAVPAALRHLPAAALSARLGVAARIGAGNLPRALGRSAIAAAALTLATALSLTVAAYTHSYERSCLEWVEQAIPADVIVSVGSPLLDRNTVPFAPSLARRLDGIDGVAAADPVRSLSVPWRGLRLEVLSFDTRLYLSRLAPGAFRRVVDGPATIPVDALGRDAEPAALVSENLAYKQGLRAGDSLELPSPTGPHRLRVAAVVVDYSSDQGVVMLDRRFAAAWWKDDRVEALHLYLAPGAAPDRVAADVRARFPEGDVFVVTAAAFKDEVRAVIRRTFGIAGAAEALALAVALLGVVGATLASVIDRARELGVLRAVGATRRQVMAVVVAEAAWLGLVASLVAAAVALPASLVFVKVIGVEASGWRVPFAFPLGGALADAAAVVALSSLGALYPAWRASRRPPVESLGFE
jgi:putative ABC transport system permease protein